MVDILILHSKLFPKQFTLTEALVDVKHEANLIAHLFKLLTVGCRDIAIVTSPWLPIFMFCPSCVPFLVVNNKSSATILCSWKKCHIRKKVLRAISTYEDRQRSSEGRWKPFFPNKKEYGDHHQTLPICVSGGTYMQRNKHEGLQEWSEVGEIHWSLWTNFKFSIERPIGSILGPKTSFYDFLNKWYGIQ